MQLQEDRQHQRQNGQKSQGLQTRLALLLPDKGPRPMEVSTVYVCQEGDSDDQDTENECETEIEQCGADETQQCDHAEEIEQWISEDYHRQRYKVKARRDAKMCCRILTVLGRKEWRTWNDVPLELRKDIERIHRNLGHASADQLEKLFPDANVSDDATSALKHFRCDACDRLERPPSKKRVAVTHADTFNDIVPMDVNFWKISFKESREKKTVKVLKIVVTASGMHIAIQVADQTAETIWKVFATGWLRWA